MFDWVGHRHYGYIFSAVLTALCLVFLAMTFVPNAGLGLQFSIAYTGGTVWEVHFEDGAPDPNAVRAILDAQGLGGSDVAITGSDEREYVLIRTEALALKGPTVVEGSAAAAVASASPVASESAAAVASASPVASDSAATESAAGRVGVARGAESAATTRR